MRRLSWRQAILLVAVNYRHGKQSQTPNTSPEAFFVPVFLDDFSNISLDVNEDAGYTFAAIRRFPMINYFRVLFSGVQEKNYGEVRLS